MTNGPTRIQLDLTMFDKYRTEFGDLVEVAYSPEVMNSLDTLNKVLNQERQRRERRELKDFLCESYAKLINCNSVKEKESVLLEVYNFKRTE